MTDNDVTMSDSDNDYDEVLKTDHDENTDNQLEEDNLFGDEDDADIDGWGDEDDADVDGWGDDADIADINGDGAIMSGAKLSQFEATIPDITYKSIHSNCDEINMIPLFAATPDLKSRSRIGAMVAIRVANLTNITTDQLEVWGLTPAFPFIALKFEFGPFYLNEAKLPKVEVGMCKTLSPDAKLHAFRLSWTIEERLNNAKLTNKEWPPKGINMKDIPQASKVNDLMESSAKEYALCLEALRQYKGDEQQALSALLDENEAHKLSKRLPPLHSCEAEFGDIMSKISRTTDEKSDDNSQKTSMDEYKSAGDETKIHQLCEMYNIPYSAASLAFSALGYDEAVDKLSDSSLRQQYLDISDHHITHNTAKKKDDRGFLASIFGKSPKNKLDDDQKRNHNNHHLPDFQSMIRTHSGGGKVRSVSVRDFFRSVVVMNGHNFLLRCLCFALKILLNGNKYCMICDKALAFAGLKPTICSDRFCQWRHDQIGLGFSLSSEVVNRADICDLLISMTYSASNAGRIQFFFPYGVRGLDAETSNESFLLAANGIDAPDLSKFDGDKFAAGEPCGAKADVAKLKKVIDLCPALSAMRGWAEEGDVVLKKSLTKIHCLLYPLLVWIITSNRCHLRRLAVQDRIKEIDSEYQFALCSATPDRERQFQDLRASNGSFLAWHGSPMGNWHSILRMGLRNYSKTKHQANGAAYGSGIYFGRQFSLSWGYCRAGSNLGWKQSKFGTQMSCMALCEICYHKDDAKHHVGKGGVYKMKGKAPAQSEGASVAAKSVKDWTKKTSNKTNRWVKTSGIYVVNQEECVMTRFFLIFPKTSGYRQLEANSLMGSLPNVVRAFK